MTYFPDLSPYSYLASAYSMVNVGWLDRDHPYTTGHVSDRVVTRLCELAIQKHNITRGYHYCHYCREESPITVAAYAPKGFVLLGTGELHVVGLDGITYSAPSLIVHYILEHKYQPPPEFIEALLEGRRCQRADCTW